MKLFLEAVVTNDRYLIYHMLGCECTSLGGASDFSGVVRQVCRDIFQGTIEIDVGGVKYSLGEPDRIYRDGEMIVLAYGAEEDDWDDDRLFFEMREAYGVSMSEVLTNSKKKRSWSVRIKVGQKIEKGRRKYGNLGVVF